MLQASSAALCRYLETALAGRCAVTSEPPAVTLIAGPGPDDGPRGIGVHLFHVACADQGLPVDSVPVRDAGGRVIGRREPVRRYRTRWLVWSWAPTAAERLALLDAVLALLSSHPVLPDRVLCPELAAGGPVQLEAAPVTGTPGDVAGVFTGLMVPARPALEVALTGGAVPGVEAVADPPTDVRVTTLSRRADPRRPV